MSISRILCAILLAILAVPAAASTINAQGGVGLTSYQTLPFQTSVYQQGFNANGDTRNGHSEPVIDFWPSGTYLTNATNVNNAKTDANAKDAAGTVPYMSLERFDDTFCAANGTAYTGETGNVTSDRAAFQASADAGAYTAWFNWHNARPTLTAINSDGTYWFHQSWTGGGGVACNSGHISPAETIAGGDFPFTGVGETFADWQDNKVGVLAALVLNYGVALSDYNDSQPYQSFASGFNPEIVTNFAQYVGQYIPGASASAQSSYINNNLFNQWTSFADQSYGRYYAGMAAQILAQEGHQALIADQCGLMPSQRRLYGTDQRIFKQFLNSGNYTCIWDNQTIQSGRSCNTIIEEFGGPAFAAAREPDYRNGVNLNAEDAAFDSAAATCYAPLTGSDLAAKKSADLKRVWLEASWAHVATRAGNTRRAFCFMSKDYSDAGTLDSATTGTLISTVVPTKPFGFAYYYSTAAEAVAERNAGATASNNNTYYQPTVMTNFKNGGGIANYFVSDAALANLQPSAVPTAWLVLDPTLPPASELNQLRAYAPVLTSLSAAQSFPNAPLKMSTNLTGFGFYDQYNHLWIVVTNLTNATIGAGTVTLTGLPVGTYTLTEQYSNTQSTMNVTQSTTGGVVGATQGTIPINIARWDTQAFLIRLSPVE